MADRDQAPTEVASTRETGLSQDGQPTQTAPQRGRIGSEVAKSRQPRRAASLFDPTITRRAIVDALKKLDPRVQMRNPVMFVVEIGSAITTIELVRTLIDPHLAGDRLFVFGVAVWLWFTVLFANFAEAMAEGRGKAQADTLRRARTETLAKRIKPGAAIGPTTDYDEVAAPQLRKGDLVLVEAGESIPGDGEVVEGVACCQGCGDYSPNKSA